ncbi:hypothetical protein [Citrobacter meridianamericanus]|uniref:hypothetical protein n=1 Tax=Citrobacter meridianamericanus TaxID=2894201 RepID=UPI00351D9956
MTEANNTLSVDFYDSFVTLRNSIDAFSCAADLIPAGGDDESQGHLFRVLACRLEGDLNALWLSISRS